MSFSMDIIPYALFTYGLTAVISLAVVGIIVLTSRAMSGKKQQGGDSDA